jgi:hypothetical protein
MVSRRRLLRLGAGAVAGTATTTGCVGSPRRGDGTASADTANATESAPNGADDAPTTPGDLPRWSPDWTLSFDDWHVLGLDVDDAADADGSLYVTLSRDGGDSAVAAVDPGDRSVRWRTPMDGEAVGGSHASYQRIARGGWGVTLDRDTVYAVAGRADEREWTALHAFDRASGDERWSLERDRELGVAGVSAGLLVATGLEFFPPADQTPVSHQTPEEPLKTVVYGVDPTDGAVAWERTFTAVEDVAVGEWGVVVATDGGLVVLGRDGARRFTVGDGPATRVEVAGDRAFVLTGEDEGATLSGVAANGDVDWRYDAPVHELCLAGDRLYAGGDAVVALDADGTVVWRDDDYGQWLLFDPDGDTLYTRSGVQQDAATAYDAAGGERWTFDPPSNNAWPEAATKDSLVATAITAEDADDPFKTVYAVDSAGEATASFGRDTVFDAVGVADTAYLADGRSTLLALTP